MRDSGSNDISTKLGYRGPLTLYQGKYLRSSSKSPKMEVQTLVFAKMADQKKDLNLFQEKHSIKDAEAGAAATDTDSNANGW